MNYKRDENADQWVDRGSWANTDPEKLGTSNTGYGPNLPGTVCDPDGTVRNATDRFSRDGVTVTTDSYKWRASGRWMIREMHVAKPNEPGVYGPDLIDRWKGRAFQQSPASSISLVGFEDEQVNWEANSALLGERMGPVRAIRETWGADSGTNVTKTEYFYRDSIAYRYRVRVHPIPPDGLYTSWDYNHDKVSTYYNELLTQDDPVRAGGVPIDGINDDVGNVDQIGTDEIEGFPNIPAFFDAPDPTFTKPLAMYNWEQVSGKDANGSLVYMFELKNAQSLENATVVPYYRDDACFDDGTGDDPARHPHPGVRTRLPRRLRPSATPRRPRVTRVFTVRVLSGATESTTSSPAIPTTRPRRSAPPRSTDSDGNGQYPQRLLTQSAIGTRRPQKRLSLHPESCKTALPTSSRRSWCRAGPPRVRSATP